MYNINNLYTNQYMYSYIICIMRDINILTLCVVLLLQWWCFFFADNGMPILIIPILLVFLRHKRILNKDENASLLHSYVTLCK